MYEVLNYHQHKSEFGMVNQSADISLEHVGESLAGV